MSLVYECARREDFDPGVSGKDRASNETLSGVKAIRTEVREGEFTGSDAPTRNRCELVISKEKHPVVEGSDWFYRLRFYVPKLTPLPPNGHVGYHTIWQFISTGPTSQPMNDFQLGSFGFADRKARDGSGPGYTEFHYNDRDQPGDPVETHWAMPASNVERSVWHEIILHRKWSSDKAIGFLEMEFDGVRQKFNDGAVRKYMRTLTKPYSAYLKQGSYRSNSIGGTAVMYHAGPKIATSRAELGAAAPPPPSPPPPPPPTGQASITCPVCKTTFTA